MAARPLRVIGAQLRVAVARAMQYRVDFLVRGVVATFWVFWNVVPLLVVFSGRRSVAGWSFDEALVVMAWFQLLKAFLEGVVNPGLVGAVEHIRVGTLDFVLLKPADAQLLVSTAQYELWRVMDVVGGVVLLVRAFIGLGHPPAAADVAVALALLVGSALTVYSIGVLAVSIAFWVIRIGNLTYLFNAIFDAGRWPIQVFRGFWRILFTFVIPLGLMTTYPAMALLGRLDGRTALAALGGAAVFFLGSRAIFQRALGHYTSASS